MDPHEIANWWDEAANEGVWWAPWFQALEGLTAAQAAWKPSPDRHSIWQLVNHMIFWHEYFVHRNQGGAPITEEDLDRRNWPPEPEQISDDAWRATRERFAESHVKVKAAFTDATTPPNPPKPQLDLRYLLFHDTYHFGQVMYIRAVQGLDPLES